MPRFVFQKSQNPGLALDVHGYFLDDVIYCIFPQGTDVSALRLSYIASGSLFADGRRVLSGITRLDLSQPLVLSCDGRNYTLETRFTQLPVMEVKTADGQPPIPYSGEKASIVNLYDTRGQLLFNDTARTRVRGNSTAALSKLPLRVETGQRHTLLGLPEDDTWALLANFMDPTMMRNQVAYDLATALDMPYVPRQQYVDLYLNGKYQGVYAATTQLGLRSGSITLPPIGDENPKGSYLLEFDVRSGGDPQTIHTPLGLPIVIDSPAHVSEALRSDIAQDVMRLEQTIVAPNGQLDGVHYTQLIDLDSLVNFYLVTEMTYNGDARKPLSVYMYKNTDGKFYMGPVWDFDLSLGLSPRETEEDATVLVLQDSWWWPYLLRDTTFLQAVKAKLPQVQAWCLEEDERLQLLMEELQSAAVNNFLVSYIGVNDYCNTLQDNSFVEEVNNLRNWLPDRCQLLVEALLQLCS